MAHITHDVLQQIVDVLPTATGEYAEQLGQIKDILQAHIDQVDALEAKTLAELTALEVTDLMALTHKTRILS